MDPHVSEHQDESVNFEPIQDYTTVLEGCIGLKNDMEGYGDNLEKLVDDLLKETQDLSYESQNIVDDVPNTEANEDIRSEVKRKKRTQPSETIHVTKNCFGIISGNTPLLLKNMSRDVHENELLISLQTVEDTLRSQSPIKITNTLDLYKVDNLSVWSLDGFVPIKYIVKEKYCIGKIMKKFVNCTGTSEVLRTVKVIDTKKRASMSTSRPYFKLPNEYETEFMRGKTTVYELKNSIKTMLTEKDFYKEGSYLTYPIYDQLYASEQTKKEVINHVDHNRVHNLLFSSRNEPIISPFIFNIDKKYRDTYLLGALGKKMKKTVYGYMSALGLLILAKSVGRIVTIKCKGDNIFRVKLIQKKKDVIRHINHPQHSHAQMVPSKERHLYTVYTDNGNFCAGSIFIDTSQIHSPYSIVV